MNDRVFEMKDNFHQATKRATSVESSLRKSGNLDYYNQCFQEQIDRGAISEVTRAEIDDWVWAGNQIHYISHHAVYKDTSPTTPLRIVCDSAVRNCYTGPSLNQCLPPN